MSAPAGPRRRDPVGRRQAIVDAAGRVIAASGLAAVTHRRVAEVAGVPVGSTTYYFTDLDDLRQAALADAARASTQSLQQWKRALATNPDLPAVLAQLAADCLADRARYRTLNELYTAAGYRPELRPLARLWSDGLIGIVEPHVGRPAAEAVAVFIDGAILHRLITDQPLSAATMTMAIAALVGDSTAASRLTTDRTSATP